MSPFICLLYLATFCVWGTDAQQNLNNIDILEPISRVSPDTPAPELPGVNDYFGWTAIFHAMEPVSDTDSMTERLNKFRVLIGAPYGTFPGGLGISDPGIPRQERSGLVYTCPVFGGSCDGVRGNLSRYLDNPDYRGVTQDSRIQQLPEEYVEGRLFDQSPDAIVTANIVEAGILRNWTFESKNGQLMGAFLFSDGNNFMACAPRWQFEFQSQERNLARGICYSSDRTLQNFAAQQPCTATNAEPGNNREDSFCAAGHSAVINNGYNVIGTPGITSNRGTLASRVVGAASDSPFDLGDSRSRNRDGMVIDVTDQYQGFRVINAYISNPRGSSSVQPDLVTSVPRAAFDYTGRLHVFPASTNLNPYIFTYCTGSQMAEFFGYSIAAADLNMDGYDEIIVGAPMYTNYATNMVEVGRVYIFSPSGGQLCPSPNHNATIIEGPNSAGGRFGTSVTSVGDLDRDGYEDFVIGAPYLVNQGNSQSGAVFVYYGRANIDDIPNQEPLQINASTVAENSGGAVSDLNTFGWSLSSGSDVDANGYNDIVIGAYRSQSVFVLRSLPVADVTISFVPIANPVDIDNEASFQLMVRASYDGVGVSDSLTVDFQIRENIGNGIRRVTFSENLASSEVGTGQFVLTAKNVEVTSSVTVFTMADIDNLDPLEFVINLVPIPRTANPGSLTDLSPFPTLRAGGENSTQVMIENFCGNDGCESDVSFASITSEILVVANGPDQVTSIITVENTGPEPALGLQVELTNLPPFVRSASINTVICTQVNGTSIRTCSFPQRRINTGESVSASVQFGLLTSMLIGNEPNITITLRLVIPPTRGNEDINLSDNTASIVLDPTAQAELSVDIEFSPNNPTYTRMAPSADILSTEGIIALQTEVTLEVAITNNGPSTIQNGTLYVWLPAQDTATSLYRLYPYRIRPGPNVICNETNVDPEGLVGRSNSGRRKRSLSERIADRRRAREAAVTFMSGPNIRAKRQMQDAVAVDCSPDQMPEACLMFTCSFQNLERDTISISFNTRLDERFYSTLLTEAERSTVFNLRAYASVEVNNDYITGDSADNNSALVMINPFIPEAEQDFLHVILWPVLGSIIILVLLIVILYFCGFFRRKKPGEGETEGDIDVELPPGEGPSKTSYSPEKAEVEAENTVL